MQRLHVSFVCAADGATGRRLQKATDEILADLRISPQLLAEADFPADVHVSTISVKIVDKSQGTNAAAGLDLLVNIAVHIGEGVVARLAAAALMSWWRETLKPRLRRRVGDDAIGADEASQPQMTIEELPPSEPLAQAPSTPAPSADLPEVDVRAMEADSSEKHLPS